MRHILLLYLSTSPVRSGPVGRCLCSASLSGGAELLRARHSALSAVAQGFRVLGFRARGFQGLGVFKGFQGFREDPLRRRLGGGTGAPTGAVRRSFALPSHLDSVPFPSFPPLRLQCANMSHWVLTSPRIVGLCLWARPASAPACLEAASVFSFSLTIDFSRVEIVCQNSLKEILATTRHDPDTTLALFWHILAQQGQPACGC